MADLLIQATAKLLDGWCGPVLLRERPDEEAVSLGWQTTRARWVVWDNGGDVAAEPADLLLDLSRAECRDRVARVLAERLMGVRVGEPAMFDYFDDTIGMWGLATRAGCPGFPASAIPALADLDPNDDTRLPDGSRLVDAQALRLCWEASHA